MVGTANVVGTTDTGNVWLDVLIADDRWTSGSGPTVVSVAFAGLNTGETVSYSGGWEPSIFADRLESYELAAMKAAMSTLSAVCNLQFRLGSGGNGVAVANADLIWASISDRDAEGNLGWAYQPGSIRKNGDYVSVIGINGEAYYPANGSALVRGGFDFITMVHELGHAVGLNHSHPEDEPFVEGWPGVDKAFEDLGLFNMNQGIYTTMGYNDGWQTAPHGVTPSDLYGWQAGPMAFDIAALQRMYGVNTQTAKGDTTYNLPETNRVGTFYSCIWDAGGTDVIKGAGSKANTIDLRAATLESAQGGGGWVSYAAAVHGGFTIANGAVIENATGGGKADRITGNAARNVLNGLDGSDELSAGGGNDRLYGGGGNDRLAGGDGNDRLLGGSGADRLTGGKGEDDFVYKTSSNSTLSARDDIWSFEVGQDRIDLSAIDARSDKSGDQAFRLDTGGVFAMGDIRQAVQFGNLVIRVNLDTDADAEMSIRLVNFRTMLASSDFLL